MSTILSPALRCALCLLSAAILFPTLSSCSHSATPRSLYAADTASSTAPLWLGYRATILHTLPLHTGHLSQQIAGTEPPPPLMVRTDSLPTISLPPATSVVVASASLVATVDNDTALWLLVAHDSYARGWTRPSALLNHSEPQSPLVRLLHYASHHAHARHIAVGLFGLLLIFALWLHRAPRHAHILRPALFSAWPAAALICTATSAMLLRGIQGLAPLQWLTFNLRPSLWPIAPHLSEAMSVWLISMWLAAVFTVAATDSLHRHPRTRHALLALLIMGAAQLVTALLLLQLPLPLSAAVWVAFVVSIAFAYRVYGRTPFVCGHCGHPIARKGTCPHCHATNA